MQVLVNSLYIIHNGYQDFIQWGGGSFSPSTLDLRSSPKNKGGWRHHVTLTNIPATKPHCTYMQLQPNSLPPNFFLFSMEVQRVPFVLRTDKGHSHYPRTSLLNYRGLFGGVCLGGL